MSLVVLYNTLLLHSRHRSVKITNFQFIENAVYLPSLLRTHRLSLFLFPSVCAVDSLQQQDFYQFAQKTPFGFSFSQQQEASCYVLL